MRRPHGPSKIILISSGINIFLTTRPKTNHDFKKILMRQRPSPTLNDNSGRSSNGQRTTSIL